MNWLDEHIDSVICGDNMGILPSMPNESVDLTVTSPPYDNLRDYKGYTFNFEGLANQLYRVTKKGGVVVWVVGDATINGSETGTSFKQALYFKEIGFNLHDTMIYGKKGFPPRYPNIKRYSGAFDYMFIFCKGKILTFNEIKVPRSLEYIKSKRSGRQRQSDGSLKPTKPYTLGTYKTIGNVWFYTQRGGSWTTQEHPALFPEQLAQDHILSWSNPGDIVLDPLMGSGTTAVAALRTDRHFIVIDISSEYCTLAEKRIEDTKREMEDAARQLDMFAEAAGD